MKISTSLHVKSFKQLAALVLLAMASVSLNSCSKDDTTAAAISGLTVVNASPTAATYNVYLNSALVNAAALPFTGTVSYFQINPGANSLKFTTASSTTSVLTKDISLEANKAYSYFLIDKAEKLDGLLVTDDLSMTSTDKAIIRFINLSPDAGTLALSQTTVATNLFEQAYKGYSAFTTTEAKTYSLVLKDKTTGATLSTMDNVVLTAGKMYTIIANGMITPLTNDQPLRIQVMTNK
jgi:hypothetical protein